MSKRSWVKVQAINDRERKQNIVVGACVDGALKNFSIPQGMAVCLPEAVIANLKDSAYDETIPDNVEVGKGFKTERRERFIIIELGEDYKPPVDDEKDAIVNKVKAEKAKEKAIA